MHILELSSRSRATVSALEVARMEGRDGGVSPSRSSRFSFPSPAVSVAPPARAGNRHEMLIETASRDVAVRQQMRRWYVDYVSGLQGGVEGRNQGCGMRIAGAQRGYEPRNEEV